MRNNTEFFKKLFEKMKNDIITNAQEGWSQVNAVAVGDDADVAIMEQENSLNYKLKGRNKYLYWKIEQALERIENGDFGLCQECGDNISNSRLRARPMATKCIHCKEEEEREENHILYENKSHTLGKSLTSNFELIEGDNLQKEMTKNINLLSLAN